MAQVRSAALGSVLGAFIGDSLGSFIEFQNNISPKTLKLTLTMPGGGPFHLGKGQVTDDSELAMCMLRGLLDGQGKLNLDAIATYYRRWISTGPFDIGITTSNALGPLVSAGSTAATCIQAAIENNTQSQSNGSLMRLTPLCVWAYKLPAEKAAVVARFESSMTHSNEIAQHAAVCYVLAIGHLIREFGDRRGAYDAAKNYAMTVGNRGIREWFTNIEQESPMLGYPKMGWAKIAFTHAFRHLIAGKTFVEAMSETLALGGDTDTNAAIVGGLIGAAVGVENLPREYVDNVTKYTFETQGGRNRPEFLNQTEVVQQVEELIRIAPDSTTVIKEGVEEPI